MKSFQSLKEKEAKPRCYEKPVTFFQVNSVFPPPKKSPDDTLRTKYFSNEICIGKIKN